MTRRTLPNRVRGIRQTIPQGYILGRVNKGNGKPELISLAALRAAQGISPAQVGVQQDANIQAYLDSLSDTWGAVLFRGQNAWEALEPGTNLDVLTTHDVGANPTWETPTGGGGGGAIFGSPFTVATPGDAFIDVPLGADGGFIYKFLVVGTSGPNNATIAARITDDNFATVKSGAANYKDGVSNSTSQMLLSSITVGAGRWFTAMFHMWGFNTATTPFAFSGTSTAVDSGGSLTEQAIAGYSNDLGGGGGPYDGLRIFCSAGDLDDIQVHVFSS